MWVFTIPMKGKKGLMVYKRIEIHDENSKRNLIDVLFQSNVEATYHEEEKEIEQQGTQ